MLRPIAMGFPMHEKLTTTVDPTKVLPPPMTGLLFLFGNALPSFALFLMLLGTPMPAAYQSGFFRDYATFFLSAHTAALFFPFFVYAIASFTLGLLRPQVAVCHFGVRLGIQCGILLAIQYCFVVGIVLLQLEQLLSWRGLLIVGFVIPLSIMILMLIPWIASRIYRRVRRYVQQRQDAHWWVAGMMFCGPALALLLGLLPIMGDARSWITAAALIPGAIVVIAAPAWMLFAYVVLARHIASLRQGNQGRLQLTLAQLLAVFSWIAAYMAAWRFAVVSTLEAYAALPTEPPSNCFIATAAARGHAQFVGSWPVRRSDGQFQRVNLQLARLKCGELAFQTLLPRLHRITRRLYDRLGPRLAKRLRHPLLADAAYLALKPCEWLAQSLLYGLHPKSAQVARQLHRSAVRLDAAVAPCALVDKSDRGQSWHSEDGDS